MTDVLQMHSKCPPCPERKPYTNSETEGEKKKAPFLKPASKFIPY